MSGETSPGLVFSGSRRPLEIEELELDPPGEGEVLVRMGGVGCVPLGPARRRWRMGAAVECRPRPRGRRDRRGAGTERSRGPARGRPRGPGWTAPCETCRACKRNEPWLCTQSAGSGHRLNAEDVRLRRPDGTPIGAYSGIGTFGERQVVAASAAIPIEPTTPPEVAALIGCAVTTGIGAVVNTAGVRAGESVVVIGLGGVGLSAVMGARLAGARTIIAVDTSEQKLELARQAGATDATSDAHEVDDLTDGGADHVVEAIGLTQTLELAIGLVRPGGTVTLVGMTAQGERASFDVYRLVEDGKQIRGSTYGSATPAVDFPRIARLYAEGRLPLDLLVTVRIGLEDVNRALEAMRRGATPTPTSGRRTRGGAAVGS